METARNRSWVAYEAACAGCVSCPERGPMQSEQEPNLERAPDRLGDLLNPERAIPTGVSIALSIGSFTVLLSPGPR